MLLNFNIYVLKTKREIEVIGNKHFFSNVETPSRNYAFIKSDNEKIENIKAYCQLIIEELGLI